MALCKVPTSLIVMMREPTKITRWSGSMVCMKCCNVFFFVSVVPAVFSWYLRYRPPYVGDGGDG